jgi:hypothetical protein
VRGQADQGALHDGGQARLRASPRRAHHLGALDVVCVLRRRSHVVGVQAAQEHALQAVYSVLPWRVAVWCVCLLHFVCTAWRHGAHVKCFVSDLPMPPHRCSLKETCVSSCMLGQRHIAYGEIEREDACAQT